MNSRYPALDIQHQRNSKYEPSTLETDTFWSGEVADRWMEVCVDLVAENSSTTLTGANICGINGRLTGTCPVDANAIQGLALRLGAQQQDVQWEHVEASIRYWRFQTDLVERLNCPHYKVADTNDHYRHFCAEPTVVAARRKHHTLPAGAIHKCELKRSTARALKAMCNLYNEGRHIDPGAAGRAVCADLVENLINTEVPAAAPARGALIVLLEMGASERMQGLFPKQFNYGMYLLGEQLDEVQKFQAQVIRLATEAGMWAARCRMIHPGRTESASSQKAAADEYAATLLRTKRKHMSITKRVYMVLPAWRRRGMMKQWEMAYPPPTKGPLYAWTTRTPGPAKPAQKEVRAKRKAGNAAR